MTAQTQTKGDRAARLDPLADIRLYSLAEAEEVLGVGHRTLQTYVRGGHIHAAKIGGRWKVSRSELDRVVREGTHNTGAKRRKPAGRRRPATLEPPTAAV